jgi:hypothetical protein
MRKLLFVLVAALVVPTASQAQKSKSRSYSSHRDDCCFYNRFSLDPYAGALKDAYDIGAPDDTGVLLGFRVSYGLTQRARLLGNFGYSNTENVANSEGLSSYYVYDNVWVMTTAGAEFDVVPGRTSASLGLQAGAGWRRVDLEGTVGAPAFQPSDTRTFTPYEVVLPSLTVRHRLTTRAAIMAALQDHIFDALGGPAQHSPALVMGVSFR